MRISVKLLGFCVTSLVFVDLLGYEFLNQVGAQEPPVECPCNFDIIPQTYGCWRNLMRPLEGQVDSEPVWEGSDGNNGCVLENGEWEYEEDMFVATQLVVEMTSSGEGLCGLSRYVRGIDGSPPGTPTLGCDPTNLPPGQVPRNFGLSIEDLTPDEVQACSCALQEYVRTLNGVNNITPINNGIPMSTEPYICSTCPTDEPSQTPSPTQTPTQVPGGTGSSNNGCSIGGSMSSMNALTSLFMPIFILMTFILVVRLRRSMK